MAKRSHSTKIKPEDGYLGARVDGTALPMLRGEHYRNIAAVANHPVVGKLPRQKDVLRKLLEGQETLGEVEVRVLRHMAQHPDLAGRVKRSLEAAADLHDAARRSDAGVGVGLGVGRSRALTSREIERDVARFYPPQRKR